MASILQIVFPCLPFDRKADSIRLPETTTGTSDMDEKDSIKTLVSKKGEPQLSSEDAALSIVVAILDAEKPGSSLNTTIQSLVHQTGGWSEYLASKILTILESVIKAGRPKSGPLQEAYDKASEAAKELVAEHPVETAVLCTIIALGILVLVVPTVIECLGFCAGFGELGPVEGSWAALWQSRYMGMVPKGSLFSYFQRLGMTWKHL